MVYKVIYITIMENNTSFYFQTLKILEPGYIQFAPLVSSNLINRAQLFINCDN